jgi:flagellum-specific ATP synthase
VKGSDPLLDEAILLYPHLEHFLKQGTYESEAYASSMDKFSELFPNEG